MYTSNQALCILVNEEFVEVVLVPIGITSDDCINEWVVNTYKEQYGSDAEVTYFFIDPAFAAQFKKVDHPGGSDSIRAACNEYALDLCMEWRVAKSNVTYKNALA